MKKRIFLRVCTSIFFLGMSTFVTKAQKISLSVGTDIPYQHYIGISSEFGKVEVFYRTGILVSPYSEMLPNILEGLGVKDVYTRLLESSYDFGWMNSIGTHYHFGKKKRWYLGPEFRLDYLTGANTSYALLEAVIGEPLNEILPKPTTGRGILETGVKALYNALEDFANKYIEIELGVHLYALGGRFGRFFCIGKGEKHRIRAELSLSKYISIESKLLINNQKFEAISERLNTLLWDDVFKKYGYTGGVGVSYSYHF